MLNIRQVMKENRRIYVLFILIVTSLSCNNREASNNGYVTSDRIYFDYQVWGAEGSVVTCMLQYRYRSHNGNALLITKPGNVQLDGQALQVDSTNFTGPYYEYVSPVERFAGKHTISFTDNDSKVYKENFVFTPFALDSELPEEIKREPFTIFLKGIPRALTPIRVVITDTSFASPDVDDIVPAVNGKLEITTSMLNRITDGPIVLELYREEDRPVTDGSKAGGRIVITYTLKRELELKD